MRLKRLFSIAVPCVALALVSCDEGRIYDEVPDAGREGLVAEAVVDAEGWNLWPEGYSVAMAAFSEGNEYALISKNIEFDATGRARVILSGIPADADDVEVCVIDRLRRRVATFSASTGMTPDDTVRINATGLDVSPAGVIQSEIFNTTCVNCHGGSNFAAAGLRLTSPHAFGELVDVPSVLEPERSRIEPYNSAESVLWRILSTDESSTWKYDHSVEVLSSERLDLLKAWIDDGARY